MSEVEKFVDEAEKAVKEVGVKLVSKFDSLSSKSDLDDFYDAYYEALAKKSPSIATIIKTIIENFEL